MWYEKSYNKSTGRWWVYICTATECSLIRTFKTEKGADNYIKNNQR
jgi:hypothetical protein